MKRRSIINRRQAIGGAAALAISGWGSGRAQEEGPVDAISAMPLRERVAQKFMFPVTGTALSAEDDAWLRAVKPGGVILTGANFGTPEEVKAFVSAIHATNPNLPPLVALDQEGGLVSRIVDDPAPGAPAMGTMEPAEIADLARQRAETLARYGFNVNFAPVADVAFGADSFMAGRAFGDDAALVAEDVAAYLGGVAGSGVLHCVKHFPGHGRVSVDSHEALPELDVNPETWWQAEALPFQAAIDVGVPMVMLGHLVAPMWDDLPASLSPAVVGVLRDQLGFAGVTVSDDLMMGALGAWDAFDIVDLAVTAGIDLLLYNGLPDAPEALVAHLAERVREGEVPEEQVIESVARLMTM